MKISLIEISVYVLRYEFLQKELHYELIGLLLSDTSEYIQGRCVSLSSIKWIFYLYGSRTCFDLYLGIFSRLQGLSCVHALCIPNEELRFICQESKPRQLITTMTFITISQSAINQNMEFKRYKIVEMIFEF